MNTDWDEEDQDTDVYLPPGFRKKQKMKDFRAWELDREKEKKTWKRYQKKKQPETGD